MPGVSTRQMNCTGVWPSGTTYITFDDVKVPVENLIGKENRGFKYIMANFNHEVSALIQPRNTLGVLTYVYYLAMGNCRSSHSFCSYLLRRSVQICAQEKGIRQAID